MAATYTGTLCKRKHDDGTGHSVRQASSGGCIECLKITEKNRPDRKEQKRAYRERTKKLKGRKPKQELTAEESRAKYRDLYVRRNYNITAQDKETMFNKQGGRCKICGKQWESAWGKDVHVDHFDVDGKPIVRGLLCKLCNVGIGSLKHDRGVLLSAVVYLERSKTLISK